MIEWTVRDDGTVETEDGVVIAKITGGLIDQMRHPAKTERERIIDRLNERLRGNK